MAKIRRAQQLKRRSVARECVCLALEGICLLGQEAALEELGLGRS
jgi:hypothetical protein